MATREEEVQRIVKATVSETVPLVVKETLTKYGIDAANPIEVQKDQQHLRKWRNRLDTMSGKVFLVCVLAVCGVGSQIFGAGLSQYLTSLVS